MLSLLFSVPAIPAARSLINNREEFGLKCLFSQAGTFLRDFVVYWQFIDREVERSIKRKKPGKDKGCSRAPQENQLYRESSD